MGSGVPSGHAPQVGCRGNSPFPGPALGSWACALGRPCVLDLDPLADGLVPAVTFCRESHPDVREGLVAPPSRTCVMKVAEFSRRLRRRRGGLRPLLYGEGERVYLQALAPHAMMQLTDFGFLAAPPERPVLGRLWVSAAGTYSPMHYDCQDTYLCQARGHRLRAWARVRASQPALPRQPPRSGARAQG